MCAGVVPVPERSTELGCVNDRAVERIGGLDATAIELDPRIVLIPVVGLRCGHPGFTRRGRDCGEGAKGIEMTDSIFRAGEIPPRGGTGMLDDLAGLLLILKCR
jgi:hypothetical protein